MQLSSAMNSPETLKTLQYNPLLYYTYYAQVWALSLELNTEIQFHECFVDINIYIKKYYFCIDPEKETRGFRSNLLF